MILIPEEVKIKTGFSLEMSCNLATPLSFFHTSLAQFRKIIFGGREGDWEK